jgi:hypothetical protein
VSAVSTTHPRATVSDRLLAAVPLASVYLWLAVVYCVEAWKRSTPWLFTDELEFTQLSRSIADTGHAARRGEPHSFRSLYILLTAAFWKIDDVAAAFAAVKYFDVLVMTSVLFPTYLLARLIMGRLPALLAAAAAAAIPSLAYSSWIVEETLAYPYSALCLYVIARALLDRTRTSIAAALLLGAVAPVVRGELVVIPIVLVLSLLFMWWSSERARTRRTSWTYSDWLGVFAIVAGAIIVFSGFMSHFSDHWLKNTAYNWTKARVFVYGDYAAGAIAVGIGVVPFVLGLASLVRTRGEPRTPELRVFRVVATATVIGFGVYTGMKAGYLSQFFESRIEERNLIYICPVLFVGTAYVLQRRAVDLWAVAAATAYTAYVVLTTPLHVVDNVYSDALGLSIFQQANRYYLLTTHDAHAILIGLLALGAAVALVLPRLGLRAGTAAAFVVGALIVAWNVTGEISAAAGGVTNSRAYAPALGEPFTWVDDATHLKPTIYFGQAVADQNPEWLLEFWNRSIQTVSSLDGSLKGPGPAGAPNITADGQLYWTHSPADPGRLYDYAVEDWPCVDFAGTHVATHKYRGGATALRQWRLIQLTKPNRLRSLCTGIYPDGWSGPDDSTYFRFDGKRAGWLRIRLFRQGYAPTDVDVRVGAIRTSRREPVQGEVLRHVRVRVPTNVFVTTWIRTPAEPFAVTAVVRNKFSPGNGDVRQLGAQTSYRWFAKKP